jgi:hypothetical protein
MDALLSLLKIRRADDQLIRRVNKFASSVREAQDARNRAVHDYWMVDRHEPKHMGKMVITAQKIARFKIVSVTFAELKADVEKIHRYRFAFDEIRRLVNGALPTLPQIPHEELHPITETPADQ